MTFEEAAELLNNGKVVKVAAQMRQWHPVILAQMLEAVAYAKRQRYHSSHPNWTAAVRSLAEDFGWV